MHDTVNNTEKLWVFIYKGVPSELDTSSFSLLIPYFSFCPHDPSPKKER